MKNNFPGDGSSVRRALAIAAAVMAPALWLKADVLPDARARVAEGEFAQAAKLFEQAIESSAPSAAVFFEYGRCLRQNGQDAEAALNFRRALILDPRFSPASAALAETNADLGLPQVAPGWRERVGEHVPMDPLAILGASLFWWGAFAVVLSAARGRRGFLAFGITAIFAGAAAIVLVWLCDPRIAGHNAAIVLASGVTARTSPVDQSEKVASLPEGSTIKILSQRGRWFYGRLPGDRTGWFPAEGIVPIIPPG